MAPSPMNSSAPTAAAGGEDTLSILVNSLSIIFFTMGLGYVGKSTGFIPGDANKGIGAMVGKICLPLLIFRNVAKLDLFTVDYRVIGTIGLVKIICFLLACGLSFCNRPTGDDAKPGDTASQYGIFTLFVTGSNDLAIGLGIIQSIYPETSPIDFGSLTFVVVGMQVAIINIPSFVCLELGKALRAASKKEGKVCPKKLAIVIGTSLLKNPILMSTFLGLIYNGINPPLSNDMTSNKNIPKLIDDMMAKGGSAFGMAALFLGGMSVVGNFKLLKGKKLVLPTILSLVKVLVAPIIGFYISMAIFSDSDPVIQKLYSQYVFIYCSFPTAGSIVVFAQAYDVKLKGMVSGASVLVLLLWSPIMFISATLLLGGNISGARVGDACHFLSIFGSILLLVTFAISPEWQKFPKMSIPQLAFVAGLFSMSHIGCYNLINVKSSTGWEMTSSSEWYFLTYFFRIWFGMLLAFSLPTDALMLWTKGAMFARKTCPATSILCLVIAVVSTCVFVAIGVPQNSLYPCWYRFGETQITYDLVLLFLQLLYGIFVLAVLMCTRPAPCVCPVEVVAGSDGDEFHTQRTTTAQLDSSLDSSVRSASNASTVSSLVDDDANEAALLHITVEEKKVILAQDREMKCGVTGGYLYRTKLMIGVNLVSIIFQILGNRSAMMDSVAGDPILDFFQIINIFVNDGKGFILFLCYVTMRTNGWLSTCQTCKKKARSCLVLNTVLGEGRQQDVSAIPLMWKRLANIIADSGIIKNRRYNLKIWRQCVPGNVLLTYMVEHGIAPTREEAMHMCSILCDYDLLHHVTYEHDASELDSFLYFRIVRSSGTEITAEEKATVARQKRWSASAPPELAPPPSLLPGSHENTSSGGGGEGGGEEGGDRKRTSSATKPKARRMSSRELLQQQQQQQQQQQPSGNNPLLPQTEMTGMKTKDSKKSKKSSL